MTTRTASLTVSTVSTSTITFTDGSECARDQFLGEVKPGQVWEVTTVESTSDVPGKGNVGGLVIAARIVTDV